MIVVLDTSVLVSGVRSRRGAAFEVLRRLPTRAFEIALSVALYTEWQAVLTRKEHLPPGTTPDDALGFLRFLASMARLHDVHYLWRPFLRDPNDDMVLECAMAGRARYIVTHNTRDFSRVTEFGISALTPAEFLNILDGSTP